MVASPPDKTMAGEPKKRWGRRWAVGALVLISPPLASMLLIRLARTGVREPARGPLSIGASGGPPGATQPLRALRPPQCLRITPSYFSLTSGGQQGLSAVFSGGSGMTAFEHHLLERHSAIHVLFPDLEDAHILRREALNTPEVQQSEAAIAHENVVSRMGIAVARVCVIHTLPGQADLPAKLVALFL